MIYWAKIIYSIIFISLKSGLFEHLKMHILAADTEEKNMINWKTKTYSKGI